MISFFFVFENNPDAYPRNKLFFTFKTAFQTSLEASVSNMRLFSSEGNVKNDKFLHYSFNFFTRVI